MSLESKYQAFRQWPSAEQIFALGVVGLLGIGGFFGVKALVGKDDKQCDPVALAKVNPFEAFNKDSRIWNQDATAVWTTTLQDQYPDVEIELGTVVLLPDPTKCEEPN